jgi:hypothetical protein
MTPAEKQLLLAEISRQPMPSFARAANRCRENANRLPSRGQLYDFLHLVMNKGTDEMRSYLKKAGRRTANQGWSRISIDGKKLSDYFREEVIERLSQLEKLDHNTQILGWPAGSFLYDRRLPIPLGLETQERLILVRLLLARFIEHLLLARAGAAPSFNESNGRVLA